MALTYLAGRPAVLFGLFLVLYAVAIPLLARSEPAGDEIRYLEYARHLTEGYYTSTEDPRLVNGPGYPLVLALGLMAGAPIGLLRELNAIWVSLALLCLYATLRLYVESAPATIATVLFGLYPPLFKWLGALYTESFSLFLICGYLLFFARWYRSARPSHHLLLLAGLFLGGLCLTKVVFGYVTTAALAGTLVVSLICPSRLRRRTPLVFALALVFCLPYLAYTYRLTGKLYYWGTNGGEVLYWMASPYAGELGNWYGEREVRTFPELSPHVPFFDRIADLPAVARDEAMHRQAIEFLRQNPGNYASNWLANVGRLVFNYPYSFTEQKLGTYFHLFPNMLLFIAVLLSLPPAYAHRHSIPSEIWVAIALALVFFALSSLVAASSRYLLVVIPIAMLWLGYVFANHVKVVLRT